MGWGVRTLPLAGPVLSGCRRLGFPLRLPFNGREAGFAVTVTWFRQVPARAGNLLVLKTFCCSFHVSIFLALP